MANNNFNNNSWAFDLDNNMISNGENNNLDTINQSISNILTTSYGSRIFLLSFGCNLEGRLFENMTPSNAESVLNEVAAAIKTFETRVTVIESQMRLIRNTDENSIIIIIPYQINSNNIVSIFKKKMNY